MDDKKVFYIIPFFPGKVKIPTEKEDKLPDYGHIFRDDTLK